MISQEDWSWIWLSLALMAGVCGWAWGGAWQVHVWGCILYSKMCWDRAAREAGDEIA